MFNKNNSKDILRSKMPRNKNIKRRDINKNAEEKIDKEEYIENEALKNEISTKLNSQLPEVEFSNIEIRKNDKPIKKVQKDLNPTVVQKKPAEFKNKNRNVSANKSTSTSTSAKIATGTNLRNLQPTRRIKSMSGSRSGLMPRRTNTRNIINVNNTRTENNTEDIGLNVFSKSKVRVIPLGGMNEVGKNMTAVEYEDEIVVVDCGLTFPEDEMLGVDLVIPDITYLEKNKDKVKALVITHGHEDHIGAVPYFLKKINVPVYATKLTLGLISNKLQEQRMEKTATLKCVKARDTVKIGKYFKAQFIHVTHSIADSTAIAVTCPVGTILFTGDFKVDFTPINEDVMDFETFVELRKKGVLLLMSDSTNVLKPGYTMSEKTVGAEFDKIFINCKKRIIVATFSSNIHRIQQIINSAQKCGRKIALVGRSMVNVMGVAMKLGYLDAPEGMIINIDDIGLYNPEQLIIITTGSQGEPMSALVRMARGEHKKVNITSNDLVIFSASAIPGNEKSIGKVTDELERLGAEIIYNKQADVHVSGHACQEELKMMLTLVKPKFFMPMHGEYRFLKKHAEIAESVGIPKENIFIAQNGKPLELSKDSARLGAQVPSGVVLVDGLGVGDVGNIVIRDRQLLSENGVIIIVVTLDRKNMRIVSGPDIVTRGFVYVRESEELMDQIKDIARKELISCEKNGITDWATIKSNVKDSLEDYIYSKTKRQPMILPVIMEIPDYAANNDDIE